MSGLQEILELAQDVGLDPFQYRYGHDTEGAVAELRERYYPEASIWARPDAPLGERPRYYPVCRTPQELALVYALRPEGVLADPVRSYEVPQS